MLGTGYKGAAVPGHHATNKKKKRHVEGYPIRSLKTPPSHHHQSRCPPLHPIAATRARPQEAPLLSPVECVSLTVHSATHLKVVVLQDSLAVRTSQAVGVEFLVPLSLEILPLNSPVAAYADAPIQLVIVALAIRRIVDHVEGCGLEWLGAGGANETFLVVSTSEPPISRRDRFPSDGFAATFAVTLLCSASPDGCVAWDGWGLRPSWVARWRLCETVWNRGIQGPCWLSHISRWR